MEDERTWAIYFSGVLALKFHPKNDREIARETFGTYGPIWDEQRVEQAAHIADLALKAHKKRWEETCPG